MQDESPEDIAYDGYYDSRAVAYAHAIRQSTPGISDFTRLSGQSRETRRALQRLQRDKDVAAFANCIGEIEALEKIGINIGSAEPLTLIDAWHGSQHQPGWWRRLLRFADYPHASFAGNPLFMNENALMWESRKHMIPETGRLDKVYMAVWQTPFDTESELAQQADGSYRGRVTAEQLRQAQTTLSISEMDDLNRRIRLRKNWYGPDPDRLELVREMWVETAPLSALQKQFGGFEQLQSLQAMALPNARMITEQPLLQFRSWMQQAALPVLMEMSQALQLAEDDPLQEKYKRLRTYYSDWPKRETSAVERVMTERDEHPRGLPRLR